MFIKDSVSRVFRQFKLVYVNRALRANQCNRLELIACKKVNVHT